LNKTVILLHRDEQGYGQIQTIDYNYKMTATMP